MKPLQPSKFANLILPLLAGGLIVGLLATLTVAAWPAIVAQPLAMIDPFWSINPSSQGVYYGYGGFLLASLFTGVLAVGCVLAISWLTAQGVRRLPNGSWLRDVLIDILHVLGAIPPVAVGAAVALWLLPAFAQTAGYSGRCYLLGIVALVGIHWPRLTLAWVQLQDSFSPDLTANARALGASRWQVLRWVKWPAMKHRVVELGLQTLVRCLGEAAGILFVCGMSGQTAFRLDVLNNTDTLATRLLSTDDAWTGQHRPALMMVALALAVLCLSLTFFGSRFVRPQQCQSNSDSPKSTRRSSFVAVVVFVGVSICYMVPLLLAGNVALEGKEVVGVRAMVTASWNWLQLVVACTLLSIPLALWAVRLPHCSSTMRWLQGCPPIVWAVAVGCFLPYGYRTVGLLLALTLMQVTWLAVQFADILKDGPVPARRYHFLRALPQLIGAVLMSMAMAVGELNILALQVEPWTTSTLLGDLAFSASAQQSRPAIVVLLGLALLFALLSRFIHRIFPAHSDSA